MTVKIGRVDLRVSSGVFNFMYAANENSTTVYPGQYLQQYSLETTVTTCIYLVRVNCSHRWVVVAEVTPMDGTPVKIITTFELWPVGLYYTLAVIGLIFTFICFLFNIIFRKRK